MQISAEWIAVEWGTSRLRVWAMQGKSVLAERFLGKDREPLSQRDLETDLLELVADWIGGDPIDVIVCGMAGGRQGWTKAPYTAVPASPLPQSSMKLPSIDPRLCVFVVPGLNQDRPADVMHGEETQIAGFLSLHDNWDGVICLAGTHTKWVQISANEVVSFQTFMTGEIFELLSNASVLRHAVSDGWDEAAFFDAMDETLSRPEALAAKLFSIRAQGLLGGQDTALARARLSGLLIGAEMAAARPYWLGQQIAVIGTDHFTSVYAQAIERQGAPVTVLDEKDMTLAGLVAVKLQLKTNT